MLKSAFTAPKRFVFAISASLRTDRVMISGVTDWFHSRRVSEQGVLMDAQVSASDANVMSKMMDQSTHNENLLAVGFKF